MGHAEGSRESQPKTGHARSASQFSENFLSSLQGRAESRLTEARFSQGRGRAGQVPGSAGFLVGCLSPPEGRAFIFSTPRAQNLGACPAGARVSGLSPAAKSGRGGPRVRASRGSPWSGQKTTDSAPLKPDGSAARPSPPKTYRLTSAWLPPSCAALSPLGNRVPRWPRAVSPTPEELHLPQGTWLPLPRPIGSDVFGMRCLPYRKRWRSFAKRPELTQEGSRGEEAGLRLPECSRANGQSLVPGTVAHFAGSRKNRKCANVPGAVPRHFRSPSGAAGATLSGPQSRAAGRVPPTGRVRQATARQAA